MEMSYCRVTSSYAVKHANHEMLHVAGLCSACHKDIAFFPQGTCTKAFKFFSCAGAGRKEAQKRGRDDATSSKNSAGAGAKPLKKGRLEVARS